MNNPTAVVDAVVIGGGPAGLSGALLLGRCRRQVLVFDEGKPRNGSAPVVQAFLGHEGISPAEMLERGRSQLAHYPNVAFYRERVEQVYRDGGTFRVRLRNGAEFRSRALLVATGLIDRLPGLAGIEDFYGHSVHQCPYCDGWESADRPIGVMGEGEAAAQLARELLVWSSDVSLFITGFMPGAHSLKRLQRRGVKVHHALPVALRGEGRQLAEVLLADGSAIPCESLFLVATQVQHDGFLEQLGWDLIDDVRARCGNDGSTGVPGLYLAGNVTEGLQLTMVAAAEGLKAAAAINNWLLEQDELTHPDEVTQPPQPALDLVDPTEGAWDGPLMALVHAVGLR